MMLRDYRCTDYCEGITDLAEKKEELNDILSINTRTSNPYSIIKVNEKTWKIKFMEMYNYKCSYCGNSIINLNKNQFEIDHFVYEKSDEFKSESSAGQLNNLFLACFDCNRAKSSFYILPDYRELLSPDNEGIKKVFVRGKDMYISISKEYINDEYINSYYKKLKFNQEIRRIDYLLLELYGLYKSNLGNELGNKYLQIFVEIQRKRNFMTPKREVVAAV